MKAALRPCGICGPPSNDSRCSKHKNKTAARNKPRLDSSWKWRTYSKWFLDPEKNPQNYFCADPFKRHGGKSIPANTTGHKRAHQENYDLFWNSENHIPLCNSCNAFQCATREGGFGNQVSSLAKQTRNVERSKSESKTERSENIA